LNERREAGSRAGVGWWWIGCHQIRNPPLHHHHHITSVTTGVSITIRPLLWPLLVIVLLGI
jgi:hypothetical protein